VLQEDQQEPFMQANEDRLSFFIWVELFSETTVRKVLEKLIVFGFLVEPVLLGME
jgi:hypothetical protein